MKWILTWFCHLDEDKMCKTQLLCSVIHALQSYVPLNFVSRWQQGYIKSRSVTKVYFTWDPHITQSEICIKVVNVCVVQGYVTFYLLPEILLCIFSPMYRKCLFILIYFRSIAKQVIFTYIYQSLSLFLDLNHLIFKEEAGMHLVPSYKIFGMSQGPS